MLIRTAMDELLKWGNNKDRRPLIVNGMRQVGKTDLIKKYGKKHHTNNYIYIDLFDPATNDIFNNKFDVVFDSLEEFSGKEITDKTLIIIDEVQNSEQAYMFIKALHDSQRPNNLICSGSYIENTVISKSYKIPLGCYQELTISPLSFYEFVLNQKDGDKLLGYTRNAIMNQRELQKGTHNQMIKLLNEYFIIGGMPNIVNTYLANHDKNTVFSMIQELQDGQKNDIIRNLSVPNQTKVLEIYNAIPKTILSDKGIEHIDKFKVINAGSPNANTKKYKPALDILTCSRVLTAIRHIDNEDIMKLIYSDMCFVTKAFGLDEMEDIIYQNGLDGVKGYIIEGFVALELRSYFKQNALNYKRWKSSSKYYEMDFIYKGKIPLEIKSKTKWRNNKSLNTYIKDFKPSISFVVSMKNFINMPNNERIRFPLYAIWLLDEYILKYK